MRLITVARPAGLALCLGCLALCCGLSPAVAVAEDLDEAKILAAARGADDLYQRHLVELSTRLQSDSLDDRLLAIGTLGRLDDPDCVPLLLPFIESTKSTPEIVAAAAALGHLGNIAASPGLRNLLANDNDPEVRIAALNAMDQLKASQAADYVPKVKDPEPTLNGSALTNLGTLAHQPAAETLAFALAHDSRAVIRRMCAIGLGKMGDRLQGPNLQDALGDSDPGVRRYAAEALVKLNYTPAIPYLLMAMEGNIAGGHINRCLQLLSKQDFGFDWRANELARKEAVERGFKWWTDNAGELAH